MCLQKHSYEIIKEMLKEFKRFTMSRTLVRVLGIWKTLIGRVVAIWQINLCFRVLLVVGAAEVFTKGLFRVGK